MNADYFFFKLNTARFYLATVTTKVNSKKYNQNNNNDIKTTK